MAELIIQRQKRQTRYFIEKLGDTLSLDMILVPSGSFVMGSPDDEPEREEREGPQHEVTISQFFMGRYPVTQAQWRFVAELGLVLATEKFWSLRKSVLPEVIETVWGQLRVAHCMLNVLMPQVVLNRSGVMSVID
jgi:formylglycine-generating enzyme required for sulfatase activity